MEKIRLSQTQTPSSTGSAASHESSNDLVSASATIDKHVIVDQVLGVRQGHRKGVRCIIKGRRKAPDTSSSSTVTGLSEQSAQDIEEHHLLRKQVYAQQRELKALQAFITQTIGPSLPPPPPPPPSDDAEDLRRNQVFLFFVFLQTFYNFFFEDIIIQKMYTF